MVNFLQKHSQVVWGAFLLPSRSRATSASIRHLGRCHFHYSALSIYGGHFSLNNSQKTPIACPYRWDMGVSFVSAKFDWSFATVAVGLCAPLYCIWPRYIESLLYWKWRWLLLLYGEQKSYIYYYFQEASHSLPIKVSYVMVLWVSMIYNSTLAIRHSQVIILLWWPLMKQLNIPVSIINHQSVRADLKKVLWECTVLFISCFGPVKSLFVTNQHWDKSMDKWLHPQKTDIITHPWPNLINGIGTSPLKFGYGWGITHIP